jgi:hypothetical protein
VIAPAGVAQLKRKKKKANQPDPRQMGNRARRLWYRERAARRREARQLANAEQIAWRKSLQATRHLLPKGYTVEMNANTARLSNMGVEADTRFLKNKRILIEYDPNLVSKRDSDKRIGALAQTFTHELAAHAKNAGQKEEDVEHREMFAPATRALYLNAARATFKLLDNVRQQRAFANAWGSDMEFQLANNGVYNEENDEDEELNIVDKSQRRMWGLTRVNSMRDAVDHPQDHDWLSN